jgi:hypothetical protein
MSEVSATFSYNGEQLRRGSITVRVDKVIVREETVPKPFLHLLLDEKTSECAWRLYDMVGGIIHREQAREYLFSVACVEGLDAAFELARKIRQNRPLGKPRFYFHHDHTMTADTGRIELTDGEEAFFFSGRLIGLDLDELPINPYAEAEYTPYTFSLEGYFKAECCIEEFFEFTKRLMASRRNFRESKIDETFDLFFKDRQNAYKQLRYIEQTFAHGQERSAAYHHLNQEQIVPFSEGYLVCGTRYPDRYYHITQVGEVYELNYNSTTDTKEAIEKALNHGISPKRTTRVEDRQKLGEIARIIGKLRPDLAVVIAP